MKKFKKHGIKVVHVTIPVKVFNQEYFCDILQYFNPLDTGHNWNVHKTFRSSGRLLNVLCTSNLHLVLREKLFLG